MPIDPNDVTWEKPFSAVNPSEVKWDKPFTPVGGNSDTSPPVFVDDYGRNIGDRPPTRQEFGEASRPFLKGGGMIAGGGLGAAGGAVAGAAMSVPEAGATSPLLVPAAALIGGTWGSGLGNDLGDWLADLISGKPHGPKESTENIKEGMTGYIAGEGAGKLIGGAAEIGTNLYRGGKNLLTAEGAELNAGKKLLNAERGNIEPTAYDREVANKAKTEELEKRLGTGPLTPAQRTGSTKAGMIEQSFASQDKDFADQMTQREAGMKESAQKKFLDTMGKGEQLPKTQPTSVTGESIHSGLEKDLAPVKDAEKAIWGEVPQYPIPSDNLNATVAELKKTPFEKPVQDAIDTVADYIKQVPRTTEGIRSIEKTLTGNMSKALKNGDNNLFRVYKKMKAAVKADYEAMGAAAESGDVALHNGEIVYPSKIREQISKIDKQIASENAKPAGPNIQAVEAALKEKSIPSMRMNGESPEAYSQRLLKDYQKHIGKDVPTLPGVDANTVKDLNASRERLQDSLANLQPAEDVAKKISEAKKFSKEQKFDRFYRGQTKKVLQAGDEFEGQKLPFEQIPKKFYTPSGYKDLVRASGSNAKAAERMRPFVVNDLIESSMKGNDFSVPKALNYLRKNQEVLKASGLDAEVKDIIKGQMPSEFERMLSTKRLDKLTGEPTFTLQEARNILSNYGKTLKELYGPKSVQALRDYHDLLYSLSRNKGVSYSGGSNTAEKILNAPDKQSGLMSRVMGAVSREMFTGLGVLAGVAEGVSSGGGPGTVASGAIIGGTAARVAARGYNEIVKASNEKTMAVFKKALIDPSLAEKLMDMARTTKPDSLAQKAAEFVKPYLGPAGVAATTEEKPPAPEPKKPEAEPPNEEKKKRRTYGNPDEDQG